MELFHSRAAQKVRLTMWLHVFYLRENLTNIFYTSIFRNFSMFLSLFFYYKFNTYKSYLFSPFTDIDRHCMVSEVLYNVHLCKVIQCSLLLLRGSHLLPDSGDMAATFGIYLLQCINLHCFFVHLLCHTLLSQLPSDRSTVVDMCYAPSTGVQCSLLICQRSPCWAMWSSCLA